MIVKPILRAEQRPRTSCLGSHEAQALKDTGQGEWRSRAAGLIEGPRYSESEYAPYEWDMGRLLYSTRRALGVAVQMF